MKFLFALVLAAVLCTEINYRFFFENYKKEFGKNYSPSEEQHRFRAFIDNLKIIEEHNSKAEETYQMGINQFTDLTPAEWKSRFTPIKYVEKPISVYTQPNVNIPDTWDWRNKGVVTPVKNQGQCGSCWAFSTTGAMEGAWAINEGSLVSLSEQELVDCDTTDSGCNGGLMDNAFKWIISNKGLCSESDYPYKAIKSSCKSSSCKSAAHISKYTDVTQNNCDALAIAVATQGPIAIAIEADQSAFQNYKSGVLSSGCGTNLDHGVLLVGYGLSGSTMYWIVKNSWGATWGNQGYIWILRQTGSNKGVCGICMMPSYPTV